MKKILRRITGLVILLLVGGVVNTELMAQQESSNPILVSNKGTTDRQEGTMVSLADLLAMLEQNFEVTFLFKDEVVQQKRVNTDKIKIGKNTGQQLAAILDQLGLTYSQVDEQTYVLFPKQTLLTKRAVQEQISGTVTDGQSGETLPGVNILVKGTSTGTSTDANGEYELTVESLQDTLVFSFVGYQTNEVPINNRTEINIEMQSQAFIGQEMVVTALGIERQSRSLGYSTEQVQPEEITVNSTANFANALQGKLSGVNITPAATGPQGSSKIRIRGQSSFGANNSPLIIVDGVPISNISYGAGSGGPSGPKGEHHNSDSGDGLSSIDPDNIKSMNVLKGAAASALYGSRAKDGVIIITTKNGADVSGIQLEYSSNFKYRMPMDFRNYQYQYGQGENGERPTSANPTSGVWSFGEKFEPGMTQILFDGVEAPYKPQPNNLKDYYRNAYNLNNTISISSGSDNGGFNLSLSNMQAQSIKPQSDYERYNVSLGFTQNLVERLTVSGNINYSKEDRNNPPNVAIQDYSPVVIYTMSNSMPLDIMKTHCCDEMGNELLWSRFTNRTNPYFALQRFKNNDRDRLYGNISANYNFTNWLSLQGRIGEDYYYRPVDYNQPTGSVREAPAPPGFVNGQYVQDEQEFREVNADFLLTIDRTFGSYGVDINLGGNKMVRNLDRKSLVVDDFYKRGIYTVSNGRSKQAYHNSQKRKVNSLYGSAQISYKDMIYLTGTARNDWFSTLSPENRSILYPSITGSFIFTEAFSSALPEWINYGKFRASYAQVGSDTDVAPYSDQLFYSINSNIYGSGSPVGGIGQTNLPNANLKPMEVDEFDFGLQMTLFSNYSFEIGYYHKLSSNQIISQNISTASGFETRSNNAAKSKNAGVEMSLNFDPVQSNNFIWSFNANAAYNTTEVLSIGGLSQITVGGGNTYGELRQVVGKPMNQIYGNGYRRDDQGRKIFNPTNGLAFGTDNQVAWGSSIPTWTGGISNSFSYKDISLSFLITFKLGNKVISGTDINAYRHGLDKRTLKGRAQGYVIGEGVNPDGSENTTKATIEGYYGNIKNYQIVEQSVYRGGSWQLRQLSLGYDFSHLISKKFIRGLQLNFVASNVLVLKKWLPHIHPNNNPTISDRSQGILGTGLPVTRNFGLNLNVKF